MKIGLVGYQGSGKSTLFHWLTGVAPDLSLAHASQAAMAQVIDPRVEALCNVYRPKKITHAALEIVDTPGLSRTHEGNAARLSHIREAGCLVFVVKGFDGANPLADLAGFDEDLLLADMEVVSNRVSRLRESLRKPKPNREKEELELKALEPLLETLEVGTPLREVEVSEEQIKASRSFQLLTLKPRFAIVNVADDEENPKQYEEQAPAGIRVAAVPVRLEMELAQMSEEERAEFRTEMGIAAFDREALIRELMDASGQMLFFTAGEKEVRTWMFHKGGTAVEAADGIHSDLARGFIRAETMRCEDLIRLGSEREIKAAGLVRQEPKDYVVQDGDILNIRFSV